jgi:hypothetical protein
VSIAVVVALTSFFSFFFNWYPPPNCTYHLTLQPLFGSILQPLFGSILQPLFGSFPSPTRYQVNGGGTAFNNLATAASVLTVLVNCMMLLSFLILRWKVGPSMLNPKP